MFRGRIIIHSVGSIRIICNCIAASIASLYAIGLVRSHISAYTLHLQTCKLLQCVIFNAPIFQ